MKCIHKLHFDINYSLDILEINARADAAKAMLSLSGIADVEKLKKNGV